MNYELSAKLVDTHCHLDFPDFEQDRNMVIQRAKTQGIEYIINIGSSLEGSYKSLDLAKNYDFIYATVGLHPHEADKFDERIKKELEILAKEEKVVAIGEIGLDYYRNYSAVDKQKKLFLSLLKLAKDLKLPVVIHNRQAENDTLEILKEFYPLNVVVHCFSGDENFLKDCLDLGFFISFTCNVTYKKADKLKSLVKLTPLERLMLETDAPFLPPEGLRGKRNEPAYVKYLAKEVSLLKELSLEEVAKMTTENAKKFFNLSEATT